MQRQLTAERSQPWFSLTQPESASTHHPAGALPAAGSYAPNELPHPQVCFAFGLLNTKPFVRSAVS